jgi:glutaconate CoA-transferase subunit B
MGWDPRISEDLGETPPPTQDELRLIRTELDPEGISTS